MKNYLFPQRLCLVSIALVAAALVALLTLSSCKKAPKVDPNKVTQEMTASYIKGIKASQAITVNYKQSEGTPKITWTANKTYAKNLNIRVEDGVLIADYHQSHPIADRGVIVNITAPSISEIEVSSAAEVNLGESLEVMGDLTMHASSAGSVKVKKLKCQHLSINASSAAQVWLKEIDVQAIDCEASSASTVILEGNAGTYNFKQGSAADIVHTKLKSGAGNVSDFDEVIEMPKTKKTKPAIKDTTKHV